MTKEEIKEYNRIYREKNKEKLRVKRTEWLSKNKDSQKEYFKLRYEVNKEKISEYNKRRRIEHGEGINKRRRDLYAKDGEAQRKRSTEYAKNNRDKKAVYDKKRREEKKEQIAAKKNKWYLNNKSTSRYKIIRFIRKSLIRVTDQARKGNTEIVKYSKSDEIIGCSLEKFITHLESGFQDGMTWDNYGEWHIDHIIPISKCLKIYNDNEVMIKVNHYTNLQPLWASENLKKSNKI